MEYTWETYLWFYKEPLMKTQNKWYLGVRTQSEDRTLIMCNECWEFFKRIHTKHLAKHWITMEEYKKKNWFNQTTGMVSDIESLKISHKILWKKHSINYNEDALEKAKEGRKNASYSWNNSNERQNKFWTCIDQVGDRLKNYIERYGQLPTYASIWEDWKAIYSLLKHRYWDINKWFAEYWLPQKHILPWQYVEYVFSDATTIRVWYTYDNWDQLVEKIVKTSKLFN